MPDTYHVTWTPAAEGDLLGIIEYLAADSVTAMSLLCSIAAKTWKLSC